MKRIQLEIKALSPLAIGRKKPGGSVSEAADYIPGSVIRGAMAAVMLQQSGWQDTDFTESGGDFQALFLSGDAAIFRNGYPAATEDVGVLPATAVSAKANPGFKPKGNGVFDTLIDRFCAESYNHLYDPSCPKTLEEGTDSRVEPFSGFYSKMTDKCTSQSVTKRLLTRVGINRRRATSEEQVLYSIEVLNETQHKQPVVYHSSILVDDDNLADQLTQFISCNSENFRLGGAASRGLGKVKIEANSVEPNIDVDSRVKRFNVALQQRWREWGNLFGNRPLENRTYFTLDLQSDAILTENWQRTMVIYSDMLRQFSQLTDYPVELHVAYSSYDYISGWNSAWGLMKDVELITNKGAVYLFSTIKDKEKDWIEALEKLELKGVGDRTCEGFGQVQVCNDFHTIVWEEAK
ncbi:type III-D CRISPR-associated RAMP protein Csx10 [Coleofasciculus sp.]|uniref:type III-D CRISPR-associated RAMP protein Csx10 n=1 Tax=Coleofasciculus sp. TaxID=3100458 RepID=UPI0039F9AB28